MLRPSGPEAMAGGEAAAAVPAWDGPTRAYHWIQFVLVCGAYYTQWVLGPAADPTMSWHRWCGYGVLILLVFRLLWGVVGSPTARFASFVRSPRAIIRYVGQMTGGATPKYLGHNPLGALMVGALLLVLGAQALTGLFTADSNSIFGGPFGHFDMMENAPAWKARLQRWHHLGANVLLGLIGLHVAVNLFCQFVKRDRLVTAMITGVKPAGNYVDATGAAGPTARRDALRGAACLAIAALLVLGGVLLAGGKL